jgi:DNA-binding winged helix-turn-helix (wHTH) protein
MRVLFGDFCFDSDRRELSARGTAIHLTPKALQLLQLLLERRPKVLRKEEIYEELWPGTFVEESNLSVLVAEVRAALRDEARKARFIKTAHGYGYGFIADARAEKSGLPSSVRLRCRSRDFELLDGENIIGRDTDAVVRINAPGISRQHARITIRNDRVTIEDLGSKNGTYVQGRRIEGAQELNDGDEIRLSRELLVVLKAEARGSTLTDIG